MKICSSLLEPLMTTFVLFLNSTGSCAPTRTRSSPSPVALPLSSVIQSLPLPLTVNVCALVVSVTGSRFR
jgi:hypothetical protein